MKGLSRDALACSRCGTVIPASKACYLVHEGFHCERCYRERYALDKTLEAAVVPPAPRRPRKTKDVPGQGRLWEEEA